MVNNAVSIYGIASKKIKHSSYTYAQRKRVTYERKGKRISYLRRTGKTATVKEHVNNLKPRESRFTFYGTADQCNLAKQKMVEQGLVPRKQYTDRLHANAFLRNPGKYGISGKWLNQDTKAS
jgi:predicted YcjX-like family ATPase